MVKCAHSTGQLSLAFADNGTTGESASTASRRRPRRGRGAARKNRRDGARAGEERCVQCGHSFDVPDWLHRRGLSLLYCGPECREKWIREYPSFEIDLTPRPGSRGGNWNLQSLRARERDHFTCSACGVSEEELGSRLDVHHTIPYRHFRSNLEANKLEHLVSVCPACHSQLEAKLRRELPLFASLRSP